MQRGNKAPTTRTRDYSSDLKRAQKNCTKDIIAAAFLFIVSAAALVWTVLGVWFPQALLAYRYALGSAAISAVLYSMLKTAEAITRKKACGDIAAESVYAVRLNENQQKLISKVLARQSMQEHFLCYAFILAVLSVILVLSYVRSGNSSSLLVLAASAVLGFAVTLIAYIRDIVRTSSRDGFCTVSGKGLIQAGKVFPFRASNGDVIGMTRFDDCYAVRFLTGGVLGLIVSRDFPLPKGGSVSREHFGEEEEPVLLSALRPLSAKAEAGQYRQMPIEQGSARAEEEDILSVVPDESLFYRITAFAALLMLIAAAVMTLR